MNNSESTDVIVLAAGKGTRMNAGVNKMFLKLHGIPVLYQTLFRLNQCAVVKRIILVSREDEIGAMRTMICEYGALDKVVDIIAGGVERADSVRCGLEYINNHPISDVVMIHDGARPFFTEELIKRLKNGAMKSDAAIPVLRLHETIRQKTGEKRAKVIDRNTLFASQTPQAFKIKHIIPCFLEAEQNRLNLTDEASYFEQLGLEVDMVEGEKWNIKITTRNDLAWAECLLGFYPELEMRSRLD